MTSYITSAFNFIRDHSPTPVVSACSLVKDHVPNVVKYTAIGAGAYLAAGAAACGMAAGTAIAAATTTAAALYNNRKTTRGQTVQEADCLRATMSQEVDSAAIALINPNVQPAVIPRAPNEPAPIDVQFKEAQKLACTRLAQYVVLSLLSLFCDPKSASSDALKQVIQNAEANKLSIVEAYEQSTMSYSVESLTLRKIGHNKCWIFALPLLLLLDGLITLLLKPVGHWIVKKSARVLEKVLIDILTAFSSTVHSTLKDGLAGKPDQNLQNILDGLTSILDNTIQNLQTGSNNYAQRGGSLVQHQEQAMTRSSEKHFRHIATWTVKKYFPKRMQFFYKWLLKNILQISVQGPGRFSQLFISKKRNLTHFIHSLSDPNSPNRTALEKQAGGAVSSIMQSYLQSLRMPASGKSKDIELQVKTDPLIKTINDVLGAMLEQETLDRLTENDQRARLIARRHQRKLNHGLITEQVKHISALITTSVITSELSPYAADPTVVTQAAARLLTGVGKSLAPSSAPPIPKPTITLQSQQRELNQTLDEILDAAPAFYIHKYFCGTDYELLQTKSAVAVQQLQKTITFHAQKLEHPLRSIDAITQRQTLPESIDPELNALGDQLLRWKGDMDNLPRWTRAIQEPLSTEFAPVYAKINKFIHLLKKLKKQFVRAQEFQTALSKLKALNPNLSKMEAELLYDALDALNLPEFTGVAPELRKGFSIRVVAAQRVVAQLHLEQALAEFKRTLAKAQRKLKAIQTMAMEANPRPNPTPGDVLASVKAGSLSGKFGTLLARRKIKPIAIQAAAGGWSLATNRPNFLLGIVHQAILLFGTPKP